jgi:BMFP domain-containing protein YqiC
MHQFGERVPEIGKDGRNLPLAFFTVLRYQADMTTTPIEDLARKLADAVPEGVRSIQSDLEKSFRSVLKTGIGKLDLVTREEFEVQEAVLQRTREKLEALEARLKELENT